MRRILALAIHVQPQDHRTVRRIDRDIAASGGDNVRLSRLADLRAALEIHPDNKFIFDNLCCVVHPFTPSLFASLLSLVYHGPDTLYILPGV